MQIMWKIWVLGGCVHQTALDDKTPSFHVRLPIFWASRVKLRNPGFWYSHCMKTTGAAAHQGLIGHRLQSGNIDTTVVFTCVLSFTNTLDDSSICPQPAFPGVIWHIVIHLQDVASCIAPTPRWNYGWVGTFLWLITNPILILLVWWFTGERNTSNTNATLSQSQKFTRFLQDKKTSGSVPPPELHLKMLRGRECFCHDAEDLYITSNKNAGKFFEERGRSASLPEALKVLRQSNLVISDSELCVCWMCGIVSSPSLFTTQLSLPTPLSGPPSRVCHLLPPHVPAKSSLKMPEGLNRPDIIA